MYHTPKPSEAYRPGCEGCQGPGTWHILASPLNGSISEELDRSCRSLSGLIHWSMLILVHPGPIYLDLFDLFRLRLTDISKAQSYQERLQLGPWQILASWAQCAWAKSCEHSVSTGRGTKKWIVVHCGPSSVHHRASFSMSVSELRMPKVTALLDGCRCAQRSFEWSNVETSDGSGAEEMQQRSSLFC